VTARRALVLGGGQQGRVIAADLARALPRLAVRVADLARPPLAPLPNLAAVEADLADATALARLVSDHDLIVGALPSRLGLASMRAALDARRPMVDVSFSAEDPVALDADARRAGVAIVPDCGLAPGISNFWLGDAYARHGTPEAATIRVGGVAQDPSAPYGYVVTWSVDDLMEEYVRPARVLRDGAVVTVPANSDVRQLDVPGVGVMEDFLSDGLRTLLHTLPGVRDMSERTLRWPGHVAAVVPLVESGRFADEIRAKCSAQPPRDLVVLHLEARWSGVTRRATLVDRYDESTGLTAMSRTTALTTAATARLAAEHGLGAPGVKPPEWLAREPGAWAYVRAALAAHGLVLAEREAPA
jgi:saccharopine dehydrogenase-like NADP-dependent oxidoreductase